MLIFILVAIAKNLKNKYENVMTSKWELHVLRYMIYFTYIKYNFLVSHF